MTMTHVGQDDGSSCVMIPNATRRYGSSLRYVVKGFPDRTLVVFIEAVKAASDWPLRCISLYAI